MVRCVSISSSSSEKPLDWAEVRTLCTHQEHSLSPDKLSLSILIAKPSHPHAAVETNAGLSAGEWINPCGTEAEQISIRGGRTGGRGDRAMMEISY